MGFAAWTIVNRSSRVVKVAQPGFLCAIVLGSLLSLSSVYPAAIDSRSYASPLDETSRFASLDAGCNLQAWNYSVGFMITFASLLTKLWRVTRIVNTTTVGAKLMSSRTLTLLAAGLVGVQARCHPTALVLRACKRGQTPKGTCTSPHSHTCVM